MAFKLFLHLILAIATLSTDARIVSPDHSRPVAPVGPPGSHNAISSHPQYSYAYNVNDALTGDSKVQHEIRNGDAVRGTYSFIESDGSRRVVHYTADAINGFNAVVHKESSSANVQQHSPPPAPIGQPIVPAATAPILNHQHLNLAPSIYPHQIHSIGNRPGGYQLQPAFQPHNPFASLPNGPALIHPHTGSQMQPQKMSVPTASAIIRPHVPVMQKSVMKSTIIPYSQASGTYQSPHSISQMQAPVFVVQPFTWYGKPHHSSTSSPINPNNKQPGMLPIVRVPTATIRPPAPAYGKIPTNHPNAIEHEHPTPYLNSATPPVILGRYGYALTNAPFKLKYN